MHCKTEEELSKLLKAPSVSGVVLLYGAEAFLVDVYAKKLVDRFSGAGDSFNLQRLDGQTLRCAALMDAVETLPLMRAEKCVLVTDLHPGKLSNDEQDWLLEIVGDVPPGCVLLLTAKAGLDKRTAIAKKLIQVCGEKGIAAELARRDRKGLTAFLMSAAKRQGAVLSSDMARYILDTCETDLASLQNEMAKICAFAGGEPLEKRHVDAVAVKRTEARVFDLSKAILAQNPQRAMEILRDLFYLREQPVMIVSVLSMAYVDLYRARIAKDSGKTQSDVTALFDYKGKEFRIGNAWNSRVSAAELRAAIVCLLDCDRRMKSTPVDAKILLEGAVIHLFALMA